MQVMIFLVRLFLFCFAGQQCNFPSKKSEIFFQVYFHRGMLSLFCNNMVAKRSLFLDWLYFV